MTIEFQIFYWTGVIIWWCIEALTIGLVLVITLLSPVVAYRRFKKKWWQWITLSKFLETGWTHKELKLISNRVSISEEWLSTAKRILELGEEVEAIE